MAEVSWIKIQTDIFDNKKIKKIRRMPEGNNITLIWIYLITKAGECNKDGGLYISEMIPYDADDIASDLDFKIDIVKLAILVLEKFGMIELIDAVIVIKNWEEYQNIEGLAKIKEQNRLRQAKFRDKQKLLTDSNVIVTLRNATEEELDKEEDKEKELIRKKKKESIYRKFDHLSLTNKEFDKLISDGWKKEQIDTILDNIENYAPNKKYKSLNLTARKWLDREYKNSKFKTTKTETKGFASDY